MKKLHRAIVMGVIFAFFGMWFEGTAPSSLWFVIGIMAFLMEYRYGKSDTYDAPDKQIKK
jgi:hypothetical protein